jgi:multidrug efflux system membrane fusion protein
MRTGQLEAVIPMPGAPGGQEKAKVDFIGNTVSAQTGTVELRADFPNTDRLLVPGQMVNVGATLNILPKAIVVPANAVNVGPDQTYVFVVNKQSKAVRVPVSVLYADGAENAVRGALKAGARVVTEGQLRLTDNTPVTVLKGKSTATIVAPGAQ